MDGKCSNNTKENRNANMVWSEHLKTRDYLEETGVDRRIILKLISDTWSMNEMAEEYTHSPIESFCKNKNEPSWSIKIRSLLNTCRHSKQKPVLCSQLKYILA
jgi:hypothetical protein